MPRTLLRQRLTPFLLMLVTGATAAAGSATWNLNPTSGDWNIAANWTPATVPNGPTDTATFDNSNITDISLSDKFEVASLIFTPVASAFTITTTENMTISGPGIVNNSAVPQNFIATSQPGTIDQHFPRHIGQQTPQGRIIVGRLWHGAAAKGHQPIPLGRRQP